MKRRRARTVQYMDRAGIQAFLTASIRRSVKRRINRPHRQGELMLVDLPQKYLDWLAPGGERYERVQLGKRDEPDYLDWDRLITPPEQLATGVYHGAHHLTYDLRDAGVEHTDHPFEQYWDHRRYTDTDERLRMIGEHHRKDNPEWDYGVCDNWEQIIEKWPHIATDETRRFILLVQVVRRHPGERQGWRWHKNGTYIGVHTPQHEYLDDEPDIEQVFMYQIIELL